MSFEDRLAHLERENRRLKLAGLLVLLVVASVLLMGQARPTSEIQAQRFTLVNTTGQRMGEFKIADDGLPGLYLYEESQQYPTVFLDITRSNRADIAPPVEPTTRLYLWGPRTGTIDTGGFNFEVSAGTANLSMVDRDGKGRIQASYEDGRRPLLQISDASFRPVWSAP